MSRSRCCCLGIVFFIANIILAIIDLVFISQNTPDNCNTIGTYIFATGVYVCLNVLGILFAFVFIRFDSLDSGRYEINRPFRIAHLITSLIMCVWGIGIHVVLAEECKTSYVHKQIDLWRYFNTGFAWASFNLLWNIVCLFTKLCHKEDDNHFLPFVDN